MEQLAASAKVERTPDTASKSKTPLYLRMYYQRHLTDLVRTFGYDILPVAAALDRAKPLVEKYGEPVMRAAADELLTIDDDGRSSPTARLSDEARQLAFQILGWPKRAADIADPPASAVPQIESDPPRSPVSEVHDQPKAVAVITDANAARCEGKPAHLSRREVLQQFVEWLRHTRQKYVKPSDLKLPGSSGKRLRTLDFVIDAPVGKRLVTVRRTLTDIQKQDMLEYQQIFGPTYEPFAAWPRIDADGSVWVLTPILDESV